MRYKKCNIEKNNYYIIYLYIAYFIKYKYLNIILQTYNLVKYFYVSFIFKTQNIFLINEKAKLVKDIN